MVIESKAITIKTKLKWLIPVRDNLAHTTKPTPSKPNTNPNHCLGVTFSAIHAANHAVKIGCRPTINAVSPAIDKKSDRKFWEYQNFLLYSWCSRK